MRYHHIQSSYLAAIVFIGFVLLFGLVALLGGEDPEVVAVLGASLLVVGAVVLWFNWLTVTIDGDRVVVAFGRGWPRRTIKVRNIAGFGPVRNKWYYGWGIRKIPRGWMYNVWGLDAVEIELSNGRKFRIGTDEPGDLIAALKVLTSLRPAVE